MTQIKIRYIVDEGDLINKPTHFVSVYKGYERLGIVEAETKKEVKKKISKWLVDNKLRTLVIPSIDLRF